MKIFLRLFALKFFNLPGLVINIFNKIFMLVNNISWENIESAVKYLANQIKEDGFEADYIIGIAVGGIVPLGLLSKELEVKNILTVSTRSYKKEKQGEPDILYFPEVNLSGMKILLVDEIANTGATLKKVFQAVKDKSVIGEMKTATLAINKKNCKFLPDYFAFSSENWIAFPWDKNE